MKYKKIKELIKLANELELHELDIERKNFKIHIRTQHDKSDANQKLEIDPATMAQLQAPAPAAQPPAANQQQPQQPQQAQQGQQAETAQKETEAADDNLVDIKSPMIGTFYRKPDPDKDPFVKVGDKVEEGDTLCIIEAMKLFNEIEAEQSGEIVEIVAEDASPVEYDQVLFKLDPNG